MDLDDEQKQRARGTEQAEADERRKAVRREEDLLADVEFDLVDEIDESLDDVFARDTAIPASPPDPLAAAAKSGAAGRHGRPTAAIPPKPKLPAPPKPPLPPMRQRMHTPVTVEPPPSVDLEFDSFEAPIDVFGQQLPGTNTKRAPPRTSFGQSEMPTAPPGASTSLLDKARRSDPPPRVERAAFLAETTRNRPLDPALLAELEAELAHAKRSPKARSSSTDLTHDSALEFVDGLDPLLHSLGPMAGLEPPAPPSSRPTGAGSQELQQAYALGDYSRALQIAEELLARRPDDISARRYAQNCRDVLTQMFAARIGPLDQVITVVLSPAEVQWLSLDHRAGFLLSLVDGQSTVDEILDISGMTRLDALKIIHDLAAQHVVRLV